MKIAHLSTFSPIQCGIAIYTADLIKALPDEENYYGALHYGATEHPDATWQCDVSRPESLYSLAESINASPVEVVSLQHEFGIWGGPSGENVLAFLDAIEKPLVTTLHTTFARAYAGEREFHILDTLVDRSDRVVVLSQLSKETLQVFLGRDLSKAVVIPHGVPDVPFLPPPPFAREDPAQPAKLISIGFLREDKGIEEVLLAIWRLRRGGWHLRYRIAGEAQKQFAGQEGYRSFLTDLVATLDLGDIVQIDNAFLTLDEQVAAVQDSHAAIFAYQSVPHASSGTFPLALAAGRPVIATPFEFAVAKHAEGPGVYVAPGYGARHVWEGVEKFLEDIENLPRMSSNLYDRTRTWRWSEAARRYKAEFGLAIARTS